MWARIRPTNRGNGDQAIGNNNSSSDSENNSTDGEGNQDGDRPRKFTGEPGVANGANYVDFTTLDVFGLFFSDFILNEM